LIVGVAHAAFLARRRSRYDQLVSAPPRRLLPALVAVIAAGISLELGVWVWIAHGRLDIALPALVIGAAIAVMAGVGLRQMLGALAHSARRVRAPVGAAAASHPWLQGTGSDPVLRDVERLQRTLGTQLDDSERLRKQAEEASVYKTEFLRSVRHELRTPLNSILGFSEVLLSDLEGPLTAGQRENLSVIARTGQRLQDLFDEVLELSAVAAGQLELKLQSVDVAALLERVGETLEEQRAGRPVHIRVFSAEALLPAAADPYRVRQLLEGIAGHALSVAQGPLLELTASADSADRVRVCVRDPARQITTLELAELTGLHPTTVRRKGLDEGTRLRIAIWRQLAALHGGAFSLQSDAEGTRFALDLPCWSER
jgi:signal transduction histidine kinase